MYVCLFVCCIPLNVLAHSRHIFVSSYSQISLFVPTLLCLYLHISLLFFDDDDYDDLQVKSYIHSMKTCFFLYSFFILFSIYSGKVFTNQYNTITLLLLMNILLQYSLKFVSVQPEIGK